MIPKHILLSAGLAVAALPALADGYKVALDGTFAPHAMPSLSGGVEGFNIDLAAAIGEALGTDMEVVAAQFSGLIPALQAGTYDFLVAPTTVTEERAANLLFTEGFMDTNFAFTVPTGTDPMEGLDAFWFLKQSKVTGDDQSIGFHTRGRNIDYDSH